MKQNSNLDKQLDEIRANTDKYESYLLLDLDEILYMTKKSNKKEIEKHVSETIKHFIEFKKSILNYYRVILDDLNDGNILIREDICGIKRESLILRDQVETMQKNIYERYNIKLDLDNYIQKYLH